MGGHSPLPAPRSPRPRGEEAQGRRGWGRFLSHSPRGLFSPWANSSPAPSFLPQSGRRLGPWDGGLDSRPNLTRWASAPAPRPRENRTPANRLLQPDPPGGAGEGTGGGGGGAGPAGWVSEGAAGNERGKNRCRRFPRAGRAGRPPSARPAAAASSHAARPGRGGGSIWVTGPSRTLGTRP